VTLKGYISGHNSLRSGSAAVRRRVMVVIEVTRGRATWHLNEPLRLRQVVQIPWSLNLRVLFVLVDVAILGGSHSDRAEED
jgi:hypothetical protein